MKVVWALGSVELVMVICNWVVFASGNKSGNTMGYLLFANIVASCVVISMIGGNLLVYRYLLRFPTLNHSILAAQFCFPFGAVLLVLDVSVGRSLAPHSSGTDKLGAAILTLSTVIAISWLVITYLARPRPRPRDVRRGDELLS
jgi:hypothetical protein